MKTEKPEIFIVKSSLPDTQTVIVDGIGRFDIHDKAVEYAGGKDAVMKLTRELVEDGWIRDSRVEFWGEQMIYGRIDGVAPGDGVLRENEFMPDDPRGFPDFPDH